MVFDIVPGHRAYFQLVCCPSSCVSPFSGFTFLYSSGPVDAKFGLRSSIVF